MILSCPDVRLICINDLLSLTVCLNLLICDLAVTYACTPVVVCLHIYVCYVQNRRYLLTYLSFMIYPSVHSGNGCIQQTHAYRIPLSLLLRRIVCRVVIGQRAGGGYRTRSGLLWSRRSALQTHLGQIHSIFTLQCVVLPGCFLCSSVVYSFRGIMATIALSSIVFFHCIALFFLSCICYKLLIIRLMKAASTDFPSDLLAACPMFNIEMLYCKFVFVFF